MILSRENLDKTVENLESLVKMHEDCHAKHPHVMGYTEEFYSHAERAEDYRILLGYLKELQQLRKKGEKH